MTTTPERARHRAAVERNTFSALADAVSSNAGTVGRQAAVIAAASGLVLASGAAATASGAPVEAQREVHTSKLDLANAPLLVADDVPVSFERPAVAGVVEAAPAVEPVAVEEQAAAPAAAAPAASAPAAANVSLQSQQVAPSPAPAPAPAPAGGTAAVIASAALAQLGVMQDCTALATNALAAAGINYHGWPAGYLSLGRTVSAAEAVPGDLIYYADGGMGLAHIAVYIGGGKAVHGGFNGNTTVIADAELGSGGVYIRVGG